ncbi:hypothetical protein ACU686_43545 [Yinghuangia aomiensis]
MNAAEGHAGVVVLTDGEYDAVHAAVEAAASSRRGGPPPTLNSLLTRWETVAAELEADGYADCAPEFDHDIRCRDTLADVWHRLPPRFRALRQPELDRIDERYRQATVPWPGHPEDEARWWHRRVPRLLNVERSLRREGDWPCGWEMMPFPKPDTVDIAVWG